jgi:hypothetical protein
LTANDTVLRDGERVRNEFGGNGAENWRVDVSGVEDAGAEKVEIINDIPLFGQSFYT